MTPGIIARCVLIVVVVLIVGFALVDPQGPDPVARPGDQPKQEQPFRFIEGSPPKIIWTAGCLKNDCNIIIYDHDGEVVRISQITGIVTLAHPEQMDQTSRRFWVAVSESFHRMKCEPK